MLFHVLQLGLCITILCSCVFASTHFHDEQVSLTLHTMGLKDAIDHVAQFLHINVIISPSVQGTVMLNLIHATPQQTFNMLLLTHHLAAWHLGNVYIIAPQNELIKMKQTEIKWQTLNNESMPLETQIWQIQYASADDIARMLTGQHMSLLSQRGSVRVDTRTNMICVRDTIKRINEIRKLIHRLDVPVQQILIEARLVSIECDYERELGLQFAITQPKIENKSKRTTSILQSEARNYSLAVAKLADNSLLDIKLLALENRGHAELISSPRLFTTNQQTASIEAGEEVPYQETSESGGTAVVFKKAVLGLKVTPQVLPGNNVLLKLQINQDRPSSKMVQGMPTISTRQMITSALVHNGQTIVLGGIYEANIENGVSGIPFLNHVPILSALFQQHHLQKSKRELLVFVTPKIINNAN